MCITLTLRTAMCGKAPSQQPGTVYTAVKNLLICWNALSAPTPTPAIPSAIFAGSGSTGVAAVHTGRRYILIEREARYQQTGAAWIAAEKNKTKP